MELSFPNEPINDESLDRPRNVFSEDFISYVFRFWFNSIKAGKTKAWVLENLPEKTDWKTGCVITEGSYNTWVFERFIPYGEFLDQEAYKALDSELIKQRVEMLTRHADVAKELQEQAIEYIREEGLENARNAVTALVQGIKIERESKGLPVAELLKLQDKSDEELLEALRDIITDSPLLEVGPADE